MSSWESWGDHPLVVTVGVTGTLIGIATGLMSIFQSVKPTQPDIVSTPPVESPRSRQEKLPQNIQSIGWIRVGAINHELMSLKDGVPLIATSQPVTVSPSVVPKIGDKIKIGRAHV